jgi:hypothetical protein
MSTSLRIDTTELISGALVLGDTGHGVLGAALPALGQHGPGFAFDSASLQPGFAGKEYRGTIDSMSPGLRLMAAEDTSFTATGPDGSYEVAWSLFEDGVYVGSSTFTVRFGP